MATAVQNTNDLMTDEKLATRYANDLALRALIALRDPAKASDVAAKTGRDDFDVQLARVALATNPVVTMTDRKYTLWSRFADKRSSVDAHLVELLDEVGAPVPLMELAGELSDTYQRPAEIYEEMLTRLVTDHRRFLLLEDEYIVPSKWFLDTEAEVEEEILFDNFIEDDEVYPYFELADKVGLSDDPATISAFLKSVGKPVKNLALQFLAYRRNTEKFRPIAFYQSVFLKSGATGLSGGYWISRELAASLAKHFTELAKSEIVEAAEAEAAAQPLTLNDTMREELVEKVLSSDNAISADALLEDMFDVSLGDKTYNDDAATILAALKSDERVTWVGGVRFRAVGTQPPYIFSVPGLLEIPFEQHFDEDGAPIDQMLEDDGLDGGLDREIRAPFAQDVLDEEAIPAPEANPPSNVRAIVKYHHKLIGTLPLCQFPAGFFPVEPTIIEAEFVLPGGQKTQVWINNETRLIYGLIDWFQSIPVDSGATFTLERMTPDRYQVNYNDETEPSTFISRNRINELMELQERAESENLSTFDIVREIIEHYKKGIEFLTLHTEVNIVRRATRRLVASILSEYHAFTQRGGAWVFDAKKATQGFDKSKRKYLLKS